MVPEHSVLGWARHDFDGGTVESVCVVQEGSEDALYLIVKRTINGLVRRYVERMASRQLDDIVDATFLDSYKTYDGRNSGVETMTLTGGTDWDQDESLTLTRSSGGFTSADVGRAVFLNGEDPLHDYGLHKLDCCHGYDEPHGSDNDEGCHHRLGAGEGDD
jgi:hypothetical protein